MTTKTVRDSNQFQDSGQQILGNSSNISAFMAYRSKPKQADFSSKAMNFHASEYRT